MSSWLPGVRVIQGLALSLLASALGVGQTSCEGETWECVNDNVSCLQDVLDEAACLQREYCTLEPACRAMTCISRADTEAACNALGVCAWNNDPMYGPVGCGFSASWSQCQYADTESACAAQHTGCDWERTCALKPRDCGSVDDQATCESRPACKWQRGTGRFSLG